MLKCNSCLRPLSLSIDRASLEVHLLCEPCSTFESHCLTASQLISIELCDPATRLRKVECFLALNASKKGGDSKSHSLR